MVRHINKKVLLLVAVITAVVFVFHYNHGAKIKSTKPKVIEDSDNSKSNNKEFNDFDDILTKSTSTASSWNKFLEPPDACPAVPKRSPGHIDTVDVYPTLNFEAPWIETREFWNGKMEKRYENRRQKQWKQVPLRVFIMPHSHNDPGWLKTYDEYFNDQTSRIINNIVDKLTKYKDMTFIWTEISFLATWYAKAHDTRKVNFQTLVEEGRLEIPTGGWIMTDEANVEVFGMVNQLIEGHQWLHTRLNVTPKSSWSCDPFGHGGTFPYILKASGLDGMLIMRIHYAWKEWFAREQQGDFYWHQQWDPEGKHDILCHNFPYDIYSIKGSCGPHAMTCLEFNFRHVHGDFSEYSARYEPITAHNLKKKAELLLTQYGKTGSLFPHNVVLVPLGDDFNYVHDMEFDQQYANYKQLMDFINQGDYNAEVSFGTLSDYFRVVKDRMSDFDTLSGDFHVYSDIFSEGRPAYWSGYYTTRPYMKQLSREVDNHLRSTEILYTYTLNKVEDGSEVHTYLVEQYQNLEKARQNLALFQHHDAITGTAKQAVMHDYGVRLYDALVRCRSIEKTVFQYLMSLHESSPQVQVLNEDFDRHGYQQPPSPLALDLRRGDNFVMVFNPLAQQQQHVVSIFVETHDFCITGPHQESVAYQINPTWNASGFFRLDTSFVEVTFVADLPALSISKFKVFRCKSDKNEREKTEVICMRCPKQQNEFSPFTLSPFPKGAITIENSELILEFDEATRLLNTIHHKRSRASQRVDLDISAYPTSQFRSGAYLLKIDDRMDDHIDIFNPVDDLKEVVVISGPVFSEVTLVFESGVSQNQPASLVHTVRLYHTTDGVKNKGVYIENDLNLGATENHNDVDIFMRLRTDIQNGNSTPEFFTDMNGFQMQKRRIVRDLKIEGNYYPITSMAFIEDDKSRVSLVVDHAQGATGWHPGWLEVMIDRRSTFDDSRGMGEGVLDNKDTTHRYWLLFEPKRRPSDPEALPLPSQLANRLSRNLNYPAIHYVGFNPELFHSEIKLLSQPLPCDIHLFNLRTLSKLRMPDEPSNEALLILQHQSSDCQLNSVSRCHQGQPSSAFDLHEVEVSKIQKSSLTGNTRKEEEVKNLATLKLDPMTLESFILTFA